MRLRKTFIGLDLEASAKVFLHAGAVCALVSAVFSVPLPMIGVPAGVLSAVLTWVSGHWTAEAQRAKDEMLKRRLGPRELSATAFEKLVELLKQAEPKADVMVCSLDIPESERYADQFKQALRTAGWTISQQKSMIIKGSTERGLFVVVQDRRTPSPYAGSLLKALLGAGVEVTLGDNQYICTLGPVVIFVAEKP